MRDYLARLDARGELFTSIARSIRITSSQR